MKAAFTLVAIASAAVVFTACTTVPPGEGYVSEGEKLYAENCTRCHRQPEQFASQDNESLKKAISKGAHRMPAFPDITHEEVQEIVAYIRNL
jgi:mono/diheme cytochrome c family protein